MKFLILVLTLLAAGCTEPERIPLTIGEHTFYTEVASTPEERQRGLMHRKSLKEDHAMIFVFENESKRSFWMKNTTIPLSIAYITKSGVITGIYPMKPLSLESVESRRSVMYALEVNQGAFQKRGIVPGDEIDLTPLKDYLSSSK